MPKARRSFQDRQRAREAHRQQVETLARSYLEVLDTPRALSVWLLLSSKQDQQLVELRCEPHEYDLPTDVDKFRRDHAATKLLQKWDRLEVPWDPKARAVEAGLEAESQCRKTNRRIRALREVARPLRTNHSRLLHLLMMTQKIVVRVLGGAPERLSFTGWSPGRTTLSFGPKISALEKFRVKPDVTFSAIGLYREMLLESPSWGQSVLQADGPCSVLRLVGVTQIARGNVALVVPKNAKIGRLISYEPHANIALQLSAGRLLRRRLLSRAGIVLDDQSINRRLALEGSRSGELATIDLSSASDTVSNELVKFLLPEEWYHLLNRIRSRETNFFGSWIRNEKFSSMGNGSTFELETLIFFALCKAVSLEQGVFLHSKVNFHVYGDDIIVPTSIYARVTELLAFCGFLVNSKKSFSTGSFRESCGVDAVGGWAITPPMIRPGQTGLSLSVSFHNRLVDYCRDTLGGIPKEYHRVLTSIRSSWPGPIGPSHYGDGHYHVNLDEASPVRAHPERGWEGWWFKTRRPFVRSRLSDFLDGSGTFTFRESYATSALLAATAPKKPKELFRTLSEGGSYTSRTLRVYSLHWESLKLID